MCLVYSSYMIACYYFWFKPWKHKHTFLHLSPELKCNVVSFGFSPLIYYWCHTPGGTFGAWFQGEDNTLKGASMEGDSGISSGSRKRSPVFVDLFGSVCYTFQHGKFRKLYGDLTRVDTRLDICSASAIAKSMLCMFSNSSNARRHNPASSPKLSLIFQQQVILVFLLTLS